MFSGSKWFNIPYKPQIIDKNLMKIIFDKKLIYTLKILNKWKERLKGIYSQAI